MKTQRANREQTIDKLKDIMVDLTETAFAVKVGSDDSGIHMSAYVERDPDGNDVCKRPPMSLDGWRIVCILVPDGYIKHILEAKRE